MARNPIASQSRFALLFGSFFRKSSRRFKNNNREVAAAIEQAEPRKLLSSTNSSSVLHSNSIFHTNVTAAHTHQIASPAYPTAHRVHRLAVPVHRTYSVTPVFRTYSPVVQTYGPVYRPPVQIAQPVASSTNPATPKKPVADQSVDTDTQNVQLGEEINGTINFFFDSDELVFDDVDSGTYELIATTDVPDGVDIQVLQGDRLIAEKMVEESDRFSFQLDRTSEDDLRVIVAGAGQSVGRYRLIVRPVGSGQPDKVSPPPKLISTTTDSIVIGESKLFRLSTSRGRTYAITASSSDLAELRVDIVDVATGKVLSTRAGGSSTALSWRGDRDGTVYVRVSSTDPFDTGEFTLSAVLRRTSSFSRIIRRYIIWYR